VLMIVVPLAFCNCIQVVSVQSVVTAGGAGQSILLIGLCVRRNGIFRRMEYLF
jgi:hypothetical protein